MPSPCFTPGFTSSPHSSFYTDQIKSWGLRTLNIIVFYLFADKINKGDLLLNYSCILVWIHCFSRCFGCYCLACVTGFLGPGLGPCRLRSGEKGKNFGERREPSGGLGRGKGGGASATLSPPQTTSRLASLADFVFFLPQCAARSQAIWDQAPQWRKKTKNGVESQVAQARNMSIGEASALL